MKKINVTLLYRGDVNYDDVRMLMNGLVGAEVPAYAILGVFEGARIDDPELGCVRSELIRETAVRGIETALQAAVDRGGSGNGRMES